MSEASGASHSYCSGKESRHRLQRHRICANSALRPPSRMTIEQWSPPGIPPSRGTRHTQNTRHFVDSVAPQIDIQRNLQRMLLANADRFTPPKMDDPIPLPFFPHAQNHAGACESLARIAGRLRLLPRKSGRGPGGSGRSAIPGRRPKNISPAVSSG